MHRPAAASRVRVGTSDAERRTIYDEIATAVPRVVVARGTTSDAVYGRRVDAVHDGQREKPSSTSAGSRPPSVGMRPLIAARANLCDDVTRAQVRCPDR
jgi:hypothetical protein